MIRQDKAVRAQPRPMVLRVTSVAAVAARTTITELERAVRVLQISAQAAAQAADREALLEVQPKEKWVAVAAAADMQRAAQAAEVQAPFQMERMELQALLVQVELRRNMFAAVEILMSRFQGVVEVEQEITALLICQNLPWDPVAVAAELVVIHRMRVVMVKQEVRVAVLFLYMAIVSVFPEQSRLQAAQAELIHSRMAAVVAAQADR